MLVELVVPLGAFMMIFLVASAFTRLFESAMLNKTIREALRSDPGSVKPLAARLEARQPWADALLGWVFVALGVALPGLALFEESGEWVDMVRAAFLAFVVGGTTLLYVRLARPA
ncbi:MAG: hypothetical protein ACT4OE_03630 [Sphingosinicella sp.]